MRWRQTATRALGAVLSAQTLTLLQSIGIIVSIALGIRAAYMTSDTESANIMLAFDQRFYPSSGVSPQVIDDLEDHKLLLKEHGGRFTKGDLDELLGNYEILDEVYKYHLISRDMIDDAFEYDFQRVYQNQEIDKYIIDARRSENEPDIYDHVDDLARQLHVPPATAGQLTH